MRHGRLSTLGAGAPEFPADIVAAIRERVRTGPPLYWTPTVGANGLLNLPVSGDADRSSSTIRPAFVDCRLRSPKIFEKGGRSTSRGR